MPTSQRSFPLPLAIALTIAVWLPLTFAFVDKYGAYPDGMLDAVVAMNSLRAKTLPPLMSLPPYNGSTKAIVQLPWITPD